MPGAVALEPYVRFDGVANYPDYAFYVKYKRGGGNPNAARFDVLPVPDGKAFRLSGQGRRVGDIALVAVPRDKAPADGSSPPVEWLSEKTPGVLEAVSHEMRLDERLFLSPVDHLVVSYRVTIREGKLGITKMSEEWVLSFANALPALALAAGIVLLGLWLVRRRRPASKPPAT
jgi:hypothetical protein